MKKNIFTSLFVFIILLSSPGAGQQNFSHALPNAHAIGIGGSTVALPSDPSAGYWNPASIAFLTTDQIIININDISQFNYTGFTKFFPPKIGFGVSIFRYRLPNDYYDLSSLSLGYSINSALAIGANFNLGKDADGELISSFGFGFFMRSFPDYHLVQNSTNRLWQWFRSAEMKNKLNFGLTFHNIKITSKNNKYEFRAGVALKLLENGPVVHFAYHQSPDDNSFHLGSQIKVIKTTDLFCGIQDFDMDQFAIGGVTRIGAFNVDISYLPQPKKINLSFVISFNEDKKLLAQKFKNRGAQKIKNNDFIGGLVEYEKAMAYFPEDDKLNFLLSVLDRKVKERKSRIDSLFAKGLDFERKGWYINAVITYRKVLEIDRKNKATRNRLKAIKPKLNRYLDELYRQGVGHFDANEINQAEIIFNKILLVDGNHKGARDYISKINDIKSNTFKEYFFRGLGYYKQKNYLRAKQEFEKALALNPNHEEAQHYVKLIDDILARKQKKIKRLLAEAENYERKNLFIKAYNRYRKIVELDKDNQYAKNKVNYLKKYVSSVVSSKYQKAKRLYNKKDYPAAISAFKEILSIDPTHRPSRNYLKRAEKNLNDLLERHYRRAQIYFERKDWDRALEECNFILSMDNKHAEAQTLHKKVIANVNINRLHEQGKKYLGEGNYLRAYEIYKQILEKEPQDRVAKTNLKTCEKKLNEQIEDLFNQGMLSYSEGDYKAAIEVWNKVLRIDPNHKSTREYIQKATKRLEALSNFQ